MIEVKTQAELDAAIKAGKTEIAIRGQGSFNVGGNSTVTAWDSATVTAGFLAAKVKDYLAQGLITRVRLAGQKGFVIEHEDAPEA